MPAVEIFNSVTKDGGNDFAEVVELLETSGQSWWLIGGLAVNVYVDSVFTIDTAGPPVRTAESCRA